MIRFCTILIALGAVFGFVSRSQAVDHPGPPHAGTPGYAPQTTGCAPLKGLIDPVIQFGSGKLRVTVPDAGSRGVIGFVCVTKTQDVAGGEGTDWGPWYTVSTSAPSPGFKLQGLTFRLEGPHPCSADEEYTTGSDTLDSLRTAPPPTGKGVGSWSFCSERTRNAALVQWEFQFQGWTRSDYIPPLTWKDVPEAIKQKAILTTFWTK